VSYEELAERFSRAGGPKRQQILDLRGG